MDMHFVCAQHEHWYRRYQIIQRVRSLLLANFGSQIASRKLVCREASTEGSETAQLSLYPESKLTGTVSAGNFGGRKILIQITPECRARWGLAESFVMALGRKY
jgi:hypothetical protein